MGLLIPILVIFVIIYLYRKDVEKRKFKKEMFKIQHQRKLDELLKKAREDDKENNSNDC